MKILKNIFRREVKNIAEAQINVLFDGLIYGATDTGKQRDTNEDCYLIMPETGLYIVADGMGGHNAGEIASLEAIKVISEYFNDELITEMKNNREKIEEELKNSIMRAHERIIEMTEAKKEYAGMGTTIAISFIYDNVLHTCHVGDSRVYVINLTGITQITRDHSSVAELVRVGKITREEARHNHMKNQITQALGVPILIEPDYNRTYRLNEGDMILMCSDGLWDMLSDREIHRTVIEGGDIEDTCKKLIRLANESGGADNITVILIQIAESEIRM